MADAPQPVGSPSGSPFAAPDGTAVLRASEQSIDRFTDALWIEDGLSVNTLAAYRRDLSLYAQWLVTAALGHLGQTDEARHALAALLALRPGTTISRIRQANHAKYPERWTSVLDGLRLAGMAE